MAGMPGVMLVGWPPDSGIVYRSPPVEPKSLMIPPISAMREPSGDHCGSLIWNFGLNRSRCAPLMSAIAKRAIHQLLSPLPYAYV